MAKKNRRAKNKKGSKIFSSNQQQAGPLFDHAFAHYQAGRLKEAEDCCRAVLATDHHHPDALHLLGMTRHQTGDNLNAIAFIKKAIAISTDNFFYHLNLGNIYFSRKNHHEAEACYQKALKLNPNFIPTIIHLAKTLEQTNRLQEAIDCYRKALAIEPNNPWALTDLGNALLTAGMVDESIETLCKLVKAAPDSAESYYNLGGALMCLGDMEEAAEQFRKALQLRPGFVNAYYNLEKTRETILEQSQPLPEKIGYYKKALSLEPNHPIALAGLGAALLAAGLLDESISTLRKLVKTAPDSAESYNHLGDALMQSGDIEEAAASYEQALAIKPKNPETYLDLGLTLYAQGRDTDAVACYKKSLTYKPDDPTTQTYLAIIAWINGDWKTCGNYLNLIANTTQRLTKKNNNFVTPYLNFLDKLLKYRETNATLYVKDNNLPTIYIVGDSHCLSAANTMMHFNGVDYLAKAKIIIGCKAWHLGNKDKNRFKYEFGKNIESIPPGATAIFMFGEIDCRIDEGIIKHYKKNNVNLTESIITLVDNYLNYVLRIVNSREIFPIICNTPARLLCKDSASDSDKKLQKNVLAKFNQALTDNVTKKHIPILDVYTSSNAQEGRPGSGCHIDGNHLWPSVFTHLIKEL
ncbi:MAG: tetratricopeptide repeat protein [Thermodesulfobacteriota bacterium]